MDNKRDFFAEELSLIRTEYIKKFLEYCIDNLPDYFFRVAASSSGKYHPEYALGNGGLLRHTKAAVQIANELFNLDMFKFDEEERDLMLVALILHDGQKQGKREGNTVFDHPLLAADFVRQCHIETGLISDEQMNLLYDCIATHMGQWNTARYSKVVLPTPKTKYQKFVHLCDYLASRKFLEVNFDKIYKV